MRYRYGVVQRLLRCRVSCASLVFWGLKGTLDCVGMTRMYEGVAPSLRSVAPDASFHLGLLSLLARFLNRSDYRWLAVFHVKHLVAHMGG